MDHFSQHSITGISCSSGLSTAQYTANMRKWAAIKEDNAPTGGRHTMIANLDKSHLDTLE
jgi:hypothetical protein